MTVIIKSHPSNSQNSNATFIPTKTFLKIIIHFSGSGTNTQLSQVKTMNLAQALHKTMPDDVIQQHNKFSNQMHKCTFQGDLLVMRTA